MVRCSRNLFDAVDEQDAVEMVDLMLEDDGKQALARDFDGLAVFANCRNFHGLVSLHHSPDARNGQAAFLE